MHSVSLFESLFNQDIETIKLNLTLGFDEFDIRKIIGQEIIKFDFNKRKASI